MQRSLTYQIVRRTTFLPPSIMHVYSGLQELAPQRRRARTARVANLYDFREHKSFSFSNLVSQKGVGCIFPFFLE